MGEYLSPPSIADSFRELDERIADIVIGPAPAWQTPVFENAWVAFGGGFGPPSYMRDMVGIVHLRGIAKSGTVGTNIFILPVGFRPGFTEQFSVASNHAFGELTIYPTGAVVLATGSNVWASLAGVSFLAER